MRNRIRRPNLEFLETQEKKHYDSLISLFKNSLNLFSILVVVFSALAGYSIKEMKVGVDQKVSEMNKKIENIELKADKKLEEVMKRSELEIGRAHV